MFPRIEFGPRGHGLLSIFFGFDSMYGLNFKIVHYKRIFVISVPARYYRPYRLIPLL